MATFNGTEFKASIGGKNVADTRDLDIEIATETIDVSTRDSLGWRELIGGQRSWTASMTGIVDYVEGGSETGVKSLVTLGIARTAVTLLFGNAATGSQNYTGSGIITRVSTSAPYEGEVEWTMDIEGTGAIVPSVIA